MKTEENAPKSFDAMAWKETVSELLSAEPEVVRERIEAARRQFVGKRKPAGKSRKSMA